MEMATAQGALGAAGGDALDEIAEEARAAVSGHGLNRWVTALVSSTVRRYNAGRHRRPIEARGEVTERRDGHAIIRRACARTAFTGAATAAIATTASVATAETAGAAGLLALPAAAVSIGVEAAARLMEHVRMSCEIAEIFGVQFDPDEPADLWSLLALTLGPEEQGKAVASPGKHLRSFAWMEGQAMGKRLGTRLLGESLLRNAVPFLDVVASSVTNWKLTRRLGDVVRRYARYRRAFDDALAEGLAPHLDLLVPGAWFLFAADGSPTPEETALLAALLRRCDTAFLAHLDEALADDVAWLERLAEIPEPSRAAFYYALEVSAAVDKRASLRERKLLRHAARALGLTVDEGHLDRMIRELDARGVLQAERGACAQAA